MKISKEKIQEIKNACEKFLKDNPGYTEEYYVTNKIGKNHLMRFRWDVLSFSKYPIWNLYADGINDTHIDSVLRMIFNHKS